ncbi:uncharacterized protein LOC125502128 [Athalia rosae]|uniref:uncharacterized protein LOC125502128 n=1 Tax=Athalia rosae TaxID=37344 RepID=UPI002033D36E|nr:uncharacterized protein LOC125502128 [Athalia rosae]
MKALEIENNRLRANMDTGGGFKSFLNADQQRMIEQKYRKCTKWSTSTIKNALKIKFSCGNNGYKEILKQKFPLPSLRTLSRRMQHISFSSGIQSDIFDLLKTKFEHVEHEHERQYVIVFDEMSIQPAKVHDVSTNQFIRNVTLPGHKPDIATHALVFMLAGVTVR